MHRPGEIEGPGALTALERRVLEAALPAGDPLLGPLRAQLAALTVLSRSHSGVGFVTRLEVPAGVAPAESAASRRLRPVRAYHPALREPAEFLLQVRDGRLAVLEAFCHEGVWPPDESAFRILDTAANA